MAKSRLKDAFLLVASPATVGLLDPAQVSAGVKEAENFQTFMAAYRERLKKQNLSDLVPAINKPDAKAGEEGNQAPPEPAKSSPQV